jgi:DNA (cytosine-5)-methyltransferase 1
MRALDLFCGAAGGWHLGLARAGIEVVAGCEADPWRRTVYQARYGVPVYPDVQTLTGEQVLADHGPIDLVAGSPPCQDASTANTSGRGVDGERTGLFFDAIRLVGELRPRWVAFENVPGLRARGIDRVLSGLEALGYAARPLVVGAVHAGAPHLRKRVVIVADLQGVGRGQGRPRRSDPGHSRKPEQAFHDAHAPTMLGAALARGQSDRVATGAYASADTVQPIAVGRRAPGGRFGGPEETQGGVARNAAGAGLSLGQDQQGDGREEQPSAVGAGLRAWDRWNGGPPALGGVDDGIPAALAARRGLGRACLAAYGDAFVPIFPELIGRAILNIDRQGVTAA